MNKKIINWLENTASSPYSPEYQAVLDRATALGYTQPSSAVKGYQNTLVSSLKTAGIWAKLDVFYVFTHGSKEFACINWITPASNLITRVSTPTWTDGVGFGSNGTSSYLNTNWKPSDGPNFVQNDASIIIYSYNHVTEGKYDVGSAMNFTGGTNVDAFRSDEGFGSAQGAINQSGTLNVANGGNAVGLWHLQRKDSANNYLFKNGSQVKTEADASSGVSNINMYILCVNNGGAAANFTTRKLSHVAFGGSLSGLESAYNTAWSTYKTAVGL